MSKNATPLKSFSGLGAWMDHVPPRTQKAHTPDLALVEPLKAVMAVDRADVLRARRARLSGGHPMPSRSAPTL